MPVNLSVFGRKETIKSATLSLMLEIKALIKKGYNVGEVVAGLKAKSISVSEATLKTHFSAAKKELLSEKSAKNITKSKKTKVNTIDTASVNEDIKPDAALNRHSDEKTDCKCGKKLVIKGKWLICPERGQDNKPDHDAYPHPGNDEFR